MNSLTFTLTDKAWQQDLLCLELEQFMLQNSVLKQERFKVVTCILEALGNSIKHASSELSDITVILHCDHDKITVDLLDKRPPHKANGEPNCPQPMAGSGRGLWIMNSWMDQVRFQPSVQGSHLRLSLLRR